MQTVLSYKKCSCYFVFATSLELDAIVIAKLEACEVCWLNGGLHVCMYWGPVCLHVYVHMIGVGQ